MPMSPRKRSSAVTLVLAGSLAGCSGEPVPQQDAYRALEDCVRDWGHASQCSPVRDDRYASSYFYGPTYFGARRGDGRPRPSPNAMDAFDPPRGTAVSAQARRGALPTGGHATAGASARAGFGSTASARGSASS